MSIYISIKDSLTALLKELYPAFDVFTEEISKTDADEPKDDIGDYFFLDIIPVSNQTVNEYHTRRSVLIDIAAHTKSESNKEYLLMADSMDMKIRPVFRFEDRAITIADASTNVMDGVLHYTFTLTFIDSIPEPKALPFMEGLDVTIKEGV